MPSGRAIAAGLIGGMNQLSQMKRQNQQDELSIMKFLQATEQAEEQWKLKKQEHDLNKKKMEMELMRIQGTIEKDAKETQFKERELDLTASILGQLGIGQQQGNQQDTSNYLNQQYSLDNPVPADANFLAGAGQPNAPFQNFQQNLPVGTSVKAGPLTIKSTQKTPEQETKQAFDEQKMEYEKQIQAEKLAEIAKKPEVERNKELKYEAESIFKNFPKDIHGNISITKDAVIATPSLGEEFLDWIGYKEETTSQVPGKYWGTDEITTPSVMPKINQADIYKFLSEKTDKVGGTASKYKVGETRTINGVEYKRNEQGQWVGK